LHIPEMSILESYLVLVVAASLAIGAFSVAAREWIHRAAGEAHSALSALGTLAHDELVELLDRAWQSRGHAVQRSIDPASRIDLRLRQDGQLWLLRCQHRRDHQIEAVDLQDLLRLSHLEQATGAILVNAGRASEEARRFIRGHSLRLIDRTGLWPLLQPALDPARRARAQRRVGRLRAVRIGLPLTSGLIMTWLASSLFWGLLSDPAATTTTPKADQAKAATLDPRAASQALAPPLAPSSLPKPDGGGSSADSQSQRFGERGASTTDSHRHQAEPGTSREDLIADLEAIDQVQAARWVAQDQLLLSTTGPLAANPRATEAICAAWARYLAHADAQLAFVDVTANKGFEAAGGTINCR
jgi:hypothetical protein